MRHLDYDGTIDTTTATTADDIIWRPERIKAKRGIVGLLVLTTVVQFQHWTKIVVKVGGNIKIDMTPAQFKLYLQRFSKRYPSAAFPADTATEVFIPFYNLEYDEGDGRRYLQQLEPGNVQVEISKNNTPGAGTAQLAWVWADEEATDFFEVKRIPLGVPVSSPKKQVDIELEAGRVVDGLIINTTGVTDYELWAGYTQNEKDIVYSQVDHGTAAMLIKKQVLDDGTVTTNPICHKMEVPLPRRVRFQITADGTYGGPNNEAVFILSVPRAA